MFGHDRRVGSDPFGLDPKQEPFAAVMDRPGHVQQPVRVLVGVDTPVARVLAPVPFKFIRRGLFAHAVPPSVHPDRIDGQLFLMDELHAPHRFGRFHAAPQGQAERRERPAPRLTEQRIIRPDQPPPQVEGNFKRRLIRQDDDRGCAKRFPRQQPEPGGFKAGTENDTIGLAAQDGVPLPRPSDGQKIARAGFVHVKKGRVAMRGTPAAGSKALFRADKQQVGRRKAVSVVTVKAELPVVEVAAVRREHARQVGRIRQPGGRLPRFLVSKRKENAAIPQVFDQIGRVIPLVFKGIDPFDGAEGTADHIRCELQPVGKTVNPAFAVFAGFQRRLRQALLKRSAAVCKIEQIGRVGDFHKHAPFRTLITVFYHKARQKKSGTRQVGY